jgi:uncharacterized membrane protein
MFLAPLFAFLGFFAAVEIRFAKAQKKALACPRTSRCDMVVHSIYGETLGISNDILGIFFYAVILALLVLFPVGQALLIVLTGVGLFFSFYLVAVQLLVLRAWCAWCALSALATIGLFVTVFFVR